MAWAPYDDAFHGMQVARRRDNARPSTASRLMRLRSLTRFLVSSDPRVQRFWLIAVMACVADLTTKEVAHRLLGESGQVALASKLTLTLIFNTGTAGGLEIGPYTWALNVTITALALALIGSVVRAMAAIDGRASLALGLVTGGAIGNLASMLAGPEGVADFIGIQLTPSMAIVANVADMALWGGALLLVPVAITLIRLVQAERASLWMVPAQNPM